MIRVHHVSIASLLAFSFLSGSASAQECAKDTDCGDGMTCVKGASVPGCNPSEECPPSVPVEDEFGYCERAPIACKSDADCPDFLRCSDEDVPCWSSSDGTSGCAEPDPNNRTCQAVSLSCSTNSDCPASFECVKEQLPCAFDCMPDTDCTGACKEEFQNVCRPQSIACDTSAACPSGWSCETELDCADTPVAPPEPGDEPIGTKSSAMCAAPEAPVCVPTGYNYSAPGKGGSLTANGESAPTSSKSSSCAVSAVGTGSGSFSLAALALLALGLRRRRS